MLVDVISVQPISGYQLRIQFEDGLEGIVDVRELVELTGVFEYLLDENQFSEVSVNTETGVIQWPNGADLDSDVLYSKITGQPIPKFEELNLEVS